MAFQSVPTNPYLESLAKQNWCKFRGLCLHSTSVVILPNWTNVSSQGTWPLMLASLACWKSGAFARRLSPITHHVLSFDVYSKWTQGQIACFMEYGRPVKKSPSQHRWKSNPKPKSICTAKAYFVLHIGPKFQVFLNSCLHWVSVVLGLLAHRSYYYHILSCCSQESFQSYRVASEARVFW